MEVMEKQILIPEKFSSLKARVLDKEDRDFYQEVEKGTAKEFGKKSRAYKTIMNGIDVKNVRGSNFFWLTNLKSYLPKNKRALSLGDMEFINGENEEFFNGFSAGVPELILRTEKTLYPQNEYLLEDFVNRINCVKWEKYDFNSDRPLRISDLELIKDESSENEYGLLLKIGDKTKINFDERFAHKNYGKNIKFGQKNKRFWTGKNGLSTIYLGIDSYLIDPENAKSRDMNGSLYSCDGALDGRSHANWTRRVVLVENNDFPNMRNHKKKSNSFKELCKRGGYLI